ncbi:transposase [Scytonema sp. PCC 10023]|uniref:transposase n=1 Tax=Scytonema sp. PCC 10023 TaxID=1680591 RepID=UPI0039C6B518
MDASRASCAEIAAALTGDYRPELVFILQQELQLYDFYQTQISACDTQIEQCLASFTSKVDVNTKPLAKPKRRGKKQPGNAPQFDLRTHLYRISGVDFTQIDGLGVLTVLTLLSELGLDPTRFPTVKHFTSWLGLCPGSRITGGKVKSSRISPSCQPCCECSAQRRSISLSQSLRFGRFLSADAGTFGCTQGDYCHRTQGAHVFSIVSGAPVAPDLGLDAYEQQYRDCPKGSGLRPIALSTTSRKKPSLWALI